ncbi:MAG: disulfide bond formation protein B [Burkholderiales bacterium]
MKLGGLRSYRVVAALGALACALLLGYGFWLQYFDDQQPCPLCLIQRGFYIGVLVVLVLAALHGPGRAGAIVYSVFAFLFAAGGAGVAARQVWLQHLPPDKVPQCGPDLYFMLDNLPLGRVIEKLIQGSGECAEVKWRFLGLSIAEWSLACFVLLALVALLLPRLRRGS